MCDKDNYKISLVLSAKKSMSIKKDQKNISRHQENLHQLL